jgi:hypothetical protein
MRVLSVGVRIIAAVRSETLGFSNAVRTVAEEARRMGLMVPGFRSPPRLPGADRTIRRSAGEPIVAVRVRGRPIADVVADVVEGVLVANGVRGRAQWQVRRKLLAAVERALVPAA